MAPVSDRFLFIIEWAIGNKTSTTHVD